MSRADVLVTVSELLDALAGDEPPTLLDVRWALTDPPGAGRDRYAAGHLPGAAFLDLETALTRHTGDPRDGRHPLPDLDVLREALIAGGVRADRETMSMTSPGRLRPAGPGGCCGGWGCRCGCSTVASPPGLLPDTGS